MADLTPEALAAAMWDDAIRPAAGDQWHLPEWEDLWGHRDELEMPGGQDMAAVILAAASMAIERLAPAHAALAAERDALNARLDDAGAQVSAALKTVSRWQDEHQRLIAERDEARSALERMRAKRDDAVSANERLFADNRELAAYLKTAREALEGGHG